MSPRAASEASLVEKRKMKGEGPEALVLRD